jgi:hypothetical protein
VQKLWCYSLFYDLVVKNIEKPHKRCVHYRFLPNIYVDLDDLVCMEPYKLILPNSDSYFALISSCPLSMILKCIFLTEQETKEYQGVSKNCEKLLIFQLKT